jgi:hypothetical protein
MAEAAVSAVLNIGSAADFQLFPTEIVIRESCGCGTPTGTPVT